MCLLGMGLTVQGKLLGAVQTRCPIASSPFLSSFDSDPAVGYTQFKEVKVTKK